MLSKWQAVIGPESALLRDCLLRTRKWENKPNVMCTTSNNNTSEMGVPFLLLFFTLLVLSYSYTHLYDITIDMKVSMEFGVFQSTKYSHCWLWTEKTEFARRYVHTTTPGLRAYYDTFTDMNESRDSCDGFYTMISFVAVNRSHNQAKFINKSAVCIRFIPWLFSFKPCKSI